MKIAAFALLIPLLGFVAPARADENDSSFTLEQRRALFLPHPTGNGYDDLISAYLSLDSDTANPAMLLDDKTPTEKQEQRRVAIESNAETLRLIRRALGRGIALPAVADMGSYGGMIRQLWRLLDVEGDFYANKGETARAVNVYLDGMELGSVASSGGNWLDFLGTSDVQKSGREDISQMAPQLSATQLLEAARRLRAIEARRPSLLTLWRADKRRNEEDFRSYFADFNRKSLQEFGFSRAETNALLQLGREKIIAQTGERYDELMRRTQWPFALRARQPLPATNRLTDSTIYIPYQHEQLYLSHRANNLLLSDALELRAIKLESGAYPSTFAASADPFGTDAFNADTPMIYHRAGESYVLYSVGPNGTDENATPIAKGEANKLLIDGDILAPVL